jgi:hypothetical protein
MAGVTPQAPKRDKVGALSNTESTEPSHGAFQARLSRRGDRFIATMASPEQAAVYNAIHGS